MRCSTGRPGARSTPCSYSRSRSGQPSLRRPGPARSTSRLLARAQPDDDKPELESLFAEELKRRGLNSMDGDDDASSSREAAGAGGAGTSARSPFAGSATKASPRTKPADTGLGDQRQRSIALVNEGLEGLLPRAGELLKLGGSVFLAFGPFIIAISLTFGGIWAVFGDHFVHTGRPGAGQPAYIDPATLLSEPPVDGYVPYQ